MKRNAFTLIETIGVIIVIAIIATITVPLIINSDKSNVISEQELADIKSSLDFYFDANPALKETLISNGEVVISVATLINEGYLGEINYHDNVKIKYNADGTYKVESND